MDNKKIILLSAFLIISFSLIYQSAFAGTTTTTIELSLFLNPAPGIILLGQSPIVVEAGSVYNDAGATASDLNDGDLTAFIVVINPVNTGVLDTYIVTYNVVDSSGNAAEEVVRVVNVVDTTPPVITLLGFDPKNIGFSSVYNDAGAIAFDNLDGDITNQIVVNNPVDTSILGNYVVTYNVVDSQGFAAAEVTRTVIVVNAKPILDFIGAQEVAAGSTLTFTATASDAEDPTAALIFSLEPVVGDTIPFGAFIDPASGVFIWTPALSQVELHTFDVEVTDTVGGKDFETIIVLVGQSATSENLEPTVLETDIDEETLDTWQDLDATITVEGVEQDLTTADLAITLLGKNIAEDETVLDEVIAQTPIITLDLTDIADETPIIELIEEAIQIVSPLPPPSQEVVVVAPPIILKTESVEQVVSSTLFEGEAFNSQTIIIPIPEESFEAIDNDGSGVPDFGMTQMVIETSDNLVSTADEFIAFEISDDPGIAPNFVEDPNLIQFYADISHAFEAGVPGAADLSQEGLIEITVTLVVEKPAPDSDAQIFSSPPKEGCGLIEVALFDPVLGEYVSGEAEVLENEIVSINANQCEYTIVFSHGSKFAVGGVKALALGAVFGLGGGGTNPNYPSIGDAIAASLGTGQIGPDGTIEFGGIVAQSDLRNQTEPQVVIPGEKLSLRFDVFENQGINNLEYVNLSFIPVNEEFVESSQEKTYIKYERFNGPLEIGDPYGFFSEAEFIILEKDATNFALRFDIIFTRPMVESNIILEVFDLDRNAVKETFVRAIMVEPDQDALPISVPSWVKSNAGWWSDGQITDSEFIQGIKYLIENGIMVIPETLISVDASEEIPDWIRNNAKWWSDGLITDSDFVSGIQWLISKGILHIII